MTLSTTIQWYYLNLQLELCLIPFFSLSVWMSGAISSCHSPGLFLLSLIFLFSCLSYSSVQSALQSVGTPWRCHYFGSLFTKKVLGQMNEISPYFQHLNLWKEHNRASVKAQACMGLTWSTWMLLPEGFDWIRISRYSWCLLAIANLDLAGL